ncbi:tetratricopeptide repeat protein [Thermotoga profunda]|uniref:tetratricopeptide repeat protein n=1 Tax=Thermotoga profunda TaxID=1508420 RepID=UPI000596E2C8|nr:tetratricopeptide repeat protein [Thermotoga profunda]
MNFEELFREAYKAAEKGEFEKAEDFYKQCLSLRQTPEIWNNLGNVYRRMEKVARAIECYQKAIELDRDYVPAYVNLASTLFNLERYDNTKLLLLRAIQLGMKDQRIVAMLIACHLALEEFIQAVDLYISNMHDEILLEELNEYGVLEQLEDLRKSWRKS